MINPIIFHIYGPFAIHWYGVMIALGVLLFIYCTEHILIQKKLLTSEQYQILLIYSLIAGALGGKLVYLVTEESHFSWHEFVHFFNAGFSILGTVISIALVVPYVLYRFNKPIWPIADICTSFVPLIQCFGRIGCFIAGCCVGTPTSLAWAVTYEHPACLAPLSIALHPTQLYSAFFLLIIFIILQYVRSQHLKSGLVSMLYLVLVGIERFVIDFWRYDRFMIASFFPFSWYQILAFIIMLSAMIFFLRLLYHESF